MAKRLRAGDVIPEFRFDTPYHPQQSFYELLEGDKPVFLVFLRNFGHPLTRNYIMEYIKSAGSLRSARLVCVVQTKPQTISKAIPEGAMPYELMCDAEGVLYRFFAVPSEKSRMKCFSLKAMKIIKELVAQKKEEERIRQAFGDAKLIREGKMQGKTWEEIRDDYRGDFYPLTEYSLQNDVWIGWMFFRPETGTGFIQMFNRAESIYDSGVCRLKGIDREKSYRITDMDSGRSETYDGARLLDKGLRFNFTQAPEAKLLRIEPCEE